MSHMAEVHRQKKNLYALLLFSLFPEAGMRSPEKPLATKVAPDDSAREIGFTGISRTPEGVDFDLISDLCL